MHQKIILIAAAVLAALIIVEPWALAIIGPVLVYAFNFFAASAFIIMLFALAKKLDNSQKNEGKKREAISLTAHQLASQLTSVKWSLQMILNNDFGRITQEQKEVLQKTYRKNERLIQLVDGLLGAARIEGGMYLAKPKPCQLENLASTAIDSYKDEMEKKKIKFSFEKPEGRLPAVIADEQKIRLAMENLIDNAIKYTEVGGQIKVWVKSKGKDMEFAVQDSGMGIKKSQKRKIFNKFFRGSNAAAKDPGGYGLGLFFVKNIVEQHRGRVWFESKENQGSVFHFSMPAKA